MKGKKSELKRKDDSSIFISPVAIKKSKVDSSTYKSELNQLAQKKKISNPSYDVFIGSNGFFATVTFNGSQFKALKVCKKKKDAEQNAAGVALNALLGTPLPLANESLVLCEPEWKRKDERSNFISLVAKEKSKVGFSSYKSELNKLAQKRKIPNPNYDVFAGSSGFFAVVTFDGSQFKALKVCKKKKDAEQNAAGVALSSLLGTPLPLADEPKVLDESDLKRRDYLSKIISFAAKEKSKVEPSTYKLELHRFAEKNKISYPSYDVAIVSDGFLATITFNGSQFKALKACKKKKDAEQNAAGVALNALLGTPLPSRDEPIVSGVTKKKSQVEASSNKRELNNLARKKKIPDPIYDAVIVNNGFFGTVTFDGVQFKALKVCSKRKHAEQNAAGVALNAFMGTPLPSSGQPIMLGEPEFKCEDEASNVVSLAAKKKSKVDTSTNKSELHHLAQKVKIPYPSYNVVIVSTGFFATVTFDGSQFKAMKVCKKRKDAEQNAAGVALSALLGTPLPSTDRL